MHKTWQISDCWNLLLLCRITRWCRCQRLRSNISCMSNALSVVYINTVYIYIYMHVCIKTQTWSKSISDMYLISFYMYMSLCLVNLLKLQYHPYLLSRPTIYTTLFLGGVIPLNCRTSHPLVALAEVPNWDKHLALHPRFYQTSWPCRSNQR